MPIAANRAQLCPVPLFPGRRNRPWHVVCIRPPGIPATLAEPPVDGRLPAVEAGCHSLTMSCPDLVVEKDVISNLDDNFHQPIASRL
jgi:hypothetical protein